MLRTTLAAGMAAFFLAAGTRASVEPQNFDLSVRPQDDFFRYANGTWVKNTPIPAEYSRWGSFNALDVHNVELLNKLCEAAAAKGAAGTPIERLVGDLYASGMDVAAADAAGAVPIKADLDRIADLKTPADVAGEIAIPPVEGRACRLRLLQRG